MDNQNWWKENQLGSILTSLSGWEERGKQKQKQNLQIHCTVPSLCKGQTSPLATLTHQYILSTGGSAVSHNPAATSAKQTQEAPARLLHTLSLQKRGNTQAEMCQPLPIATQQENSSCESWWHSPLPSLLNTRAFKLHVSCLAGVVFTLLQDTLQAIEKKKWERTLATT